MLGSLLLCALGSGLARKLLLNQLPASAVDARLLLSTLPLDADAKRRALVALDARAPLVTAPLLSAAQCVAVRKWAAPRIDTRTLDSVDGVPEQQVTVPAETLARLVGADTYAVMRGWPDAHGRRGGGNGGGGGGDGGGPPRAPRPRAPRAFSAFVRKYAPASKRSRLPFHLDTNAYTLNVALTADDDVRGGRLLALHAGRVLDVRRAAGDATLHDNTVCHAVSDVAEGTRYALLLFFYARAVHPFAVRAARRPTPAAPVTAPRPRRTARRPPGT